LLQVFPFTVREKQNIVYENPFMLLIAELTMDENKNTACECGWYKRKSQNILCEMPLSTLKSL
jgi:hypothetical protein